MATIVATIELFAPNVPKFSTGHNSFVAHVAFSNNRILPTSDQVGFDMVRQQDDVGFDDHLSVSVTLIDAGDGMSQSLY